MQVFSSEFLCVKFLSVVILCSRNVVVAAGFDAVNNSDTITETVTSGLSGDEGNKDTSTVVVLDTTTTPTVSSIATGSTTDWTTTTDNFPNRSFTASVIPISDNSQLRIIPYIATDGGGNLTTIPVTTDPTSDNTTSTPFAPTTAITNTSPFTPSSDNTTTTPAPTSPITNTSPLTSTSDNITTPFAPTSESTTTQPSNVTTTVGPCQPLDSFNLTITGVSKSEANITIAGSCDYNSICLTEIFINCSATVENNTLWDWVIQSRSVDFKLNDTNYHDGNIGPLSAFTNYTCELISDNSTKSSSFFQTEQEGPSSPVNLTITEITSTSFNITWEEPIQIPTNLTGYEVTITRKYVASDGHFYNNCSGNDNYSTNVNETSFFFHEALPDFVYEITVAALSTYGYGESSSTAANTLAAASNPPENVHTYPDEQGNNRSIDLFQNITWNMPCNTNGPVSHFQIELTGTYLYNGTRIDLRNTTVPISNNQTFYYHFLETWAATNYTFKLYLVGNITGTESSGFFNTSDNYPSAPILDTPIVTSHDLNLTWIEPDNYPGEIISYTVYIVGQGTNWQQTRYCNISDAKYSETNTVHYTNFYTTRIVPSANYSVSISANTSRGEGNSTSLMVTTNMTSPDPLAVLQVYDISEPHADTYNATVTIRFEPGCFNGIFDYFDVQFAGTRTGYENHTGTQSVSLYNITFSFDLQPQYNYIVVMETWNKEFGTYSKPLNFTAPAGVPVINSSTIASIPITTEVTQMSLTLKRKFFDESQGNLRYIAIIISNKNITGGTFHSWEDNSQWPYPTGDATIYYQATPTFWNPFSGNDTTHEYIIGNDASCDQAQYCNRPLQPNSQYYVLFRLFNDNFYRNTIPVSFITEEVSKLKDILISLGVLLSLCLIALIIFILWRKGYITVKKKEVDAVEGSSNALLSDSGEMCQCKRKLALPPSKTEITKKKFIAYCKYLEQTPSALTEQWNELEKMSKIIYEESPHHFATLAENRRKNRYTNILPFDHSRVKINIDEDDEICSDYINASFIKGFSGGQEYIATQGPLPGTCRDFWKMILQERVSIIVMVSRFIENNRDKCYKYFPNNRETMTIGDGDDIEVRCSMELHFGFYCIRTLQVKKELAQITVTHMQFLEWPDFGVPSGTDSMLNFCHQFKERWTNEGGMALVHCSAGVGRTGTIIATDILLRAVAAGRKIDVFNTVLDLRKQRQSMVQTEKQYMYIYQLIRSMIEFPIVDEQGNNEHLYENIELTNKNGIVESAL